MNTFFNKRNIALIIVVLGLFGLADASYLTFMNINQLSLPCTIFDGCNEVAKSPYSRVFGVPLSLFGAVFYLTTSLVGVGYLIKEDYRIIKITLGLSSIGFILSLYFLYLQGFVIKAFCIYCIASAIIATLLFVFSIILKRALTW